jgi:hypothetical protein
MRRRAAPFAAAFLAAALLAAAARPAAAQLPAAAPSPQPWADVRAAQPAADASLNREGQPLMTPTYVKIAGREVYYEVPQDPVGLLFFFHGCVHNAFDHWYKQTSCPECRGAGRGGGAALVVPALTPVLGLHCWAEAAAAGGRQPAADACPGHTYAPASATSKTPKSIVTTTGPLCRPAGGGVSHQAGAGAGVCFCSHQLY